MNNEQEIKLEKFTKELTTLHYALLGGLILVTAVITVQFSVYEMKFNFSEDIYILICVLLAFAGVLIGIKLFDKKILDLQNTSDFDEKLAGYRAATVMKFSLVEGPALISVVISMSKGNLLYIIISVVLIFYFFTLRVTRDKIEEDIGL